MFLPLWPLFALQVRGFPEGAEDAWQKAPDSLTTMHQQEKLKDEGDDEDDDDEAVTRPGRMCLWFVSVCCLCSFVLTVVVCWFLL